MMEIRKLDKEQWKKYPLHFSYSTDGYYSFHVHEWDFQLMFHAYEAPVQKGFTSHLFEEWWEAPVAFGAFEDGALAGVIECSPESWNNRFRITNLLVMEAFRGRGIGTALMDAALNAARDGRARMAVLETQSCNRKAIDFYTKVGFRPIGFDLFSYTNRDPQQTEVRIEMAKPLLP